MTFLQCRLQIISRILPDVVCHAFSYALPLARRNESTQQSGVWKWNVGHASFHRNQPGIELGLAQGAESQKQMYADGNVRRNQALEKLRQTRISKQDRLQLRFDNRIELDVHLESVQPSISRSFEKGPDACSREMSPNV